MKVAALFLTSYEILRAHGFIDPSWSILKAEFEIGVDEQDEVRTGSGSDRVIAFQVSTLVGRLACCFHDVATLTANRSLTLPVLTSRSARVKSFGDCYNPNCSE